MRVKRRNSATGCSQSGRRRAGDPGGVGQHVEAAGCLEYGAKAAASTTEVSVASISRCTGAAASSSMAARRIPGDHPAALAYDPGGAVAADARGANGHDASARPGTIRPRRPRSGARRRRSGAGGRGPRCRAPSRRLRAGTAPRACGPRRRLAACRWSGCRPASA